MLFESAASIMYIVSYMFKVESRKNKLCFNLSGFVDFFAFLKKFLLLLLLPFHLLFICIISYFCGYFEWFFNCFCF